MKNLFLLVAFILSTSLLFANTNKAATSLKDSYTKMPVFEWKYYLKKHPDVKQVMGYSKKAAETHWLKHGMKEGRASSPSFHVRWYVNHYSDLKKAFGKNYKAAVNHYIKHGIKEGRKGNATAKPAPKPSPKPKPIPKPVNAYLEMPVFDWKYYLNSNPDISRALGNSKKAAESHWLKYGIKEGRASSSKFAVRMYLNGYVDLKKTFGVNYKKGVDHYIKHGIKEGRNGRPKPVAMPKPKPRPKPIPKPTPNSGPTSHDIRLMYNNIPFNQSKTQAQRLMKGEKMTTLKFPKYPKLGVIIHEIFIKDAKIALGGDLRQDALNLIARVGNKLTPSQIGDVRAIYGDGDGRGHSRHFQPQQTRAFIVLDFVKGEGYLLSNKSHLQIDLKWSPDIHKSFDAKSVHFAWKPLEFHRQWTKNWVYADWVTADKFRLRYSLRNSVIGSELASYTIDHQIIIDRKTGNVYLEGDRFPSTGTYQYLPGGGIKTKNTRHQGNIHQLSDPQRFMYNRTYNLKPGK